MSYIRVIDRRDVQTALERIALEQPDQTNALHQGVCVYTNAEGRHCLVGQVFVELGIRCPDADEPMSVQSSSPSTLKAQGYWPGVEITDDATELLDVAQNYADSEDYPRCWSEAVLRTLAAHGAHTAPTADEILAVLDNAAAVCRIVAQGCVMLPEEVATALLTLSQCERISLQIEQTRKHKQAWPAPYDTELPFDLRRVDL